MNLPADDYLLLSVVNTRLRDEYGSLAELAAAEGAEENEIRARLLSIGFGYDEEENAFKPV